MGVFKRLKMGLVLAKDSALLMAHNPKLALFPLVSGITGLAFLAVFLGTLFGVTAIAPEGAALAVLFLLYLGLTFTSTFFAAGLVHQTRHVLEGGQPSLRAGIKAAWGVKKPLFVWAFISATIGMIINAIENSESRAARIFGLLFGAAWTLLTFFVVPVIVFEKPSIKQMFTKSAGTFRQTWGETPISLIGIQIVSLLVLVPFVLLGIFAFSLGMALPVFVLFFAGILASFLVVQTLEGIVKTTLYMYATTGVNPSEFDNIDFDQLTSGTKQGPSNIAGPTTSFQ